MEIRIEDENGIIYVGTAEEYLEQNEYDTELELFLSEFETSRKDETKYNGLTFYRELSLIWED